MLATEARVLTDRNSIPDETIYDEIRLAAKRGFYSITRYGNEGHRPLSDLEEAELIKLGYKLTEETYDFQPCTGCEEVTRISW